MTSRHPRHVGVTALVGAVPQLLVIAVRRAGRYKHTLVTVGLVATMVVGTAYLTFGALRVDPFDTPLTVHVHLAQSGGLLPGQDVTLRGIPIGRVQAVDLTDDGVVAVARVDAHTKIPADSPARVSGLSLAGEQYLDFRPTSSGGPYLSDGAQLPVSKTTTPLSLATVLGDLDGLLAQVEPDKLSDILGELRMSTQGPQKLKAIVDGGVFMLATLDSVLPQTTSLLRTSRAVFTTLNDIDPGLRQTAADLHQVLTGATAKDAGLRTLLDQGPAGLGALDDVIADNSPTMVQLLGDLTTIAQLSYLRVPALQALFPDSRGSTLAAIGTALHDGGLWAAIDLYPRYSCDYDLPRLPPSVPDFPEPYLNTYCSNLDPGVLVRGARNAPRPPGDDAGGVLPPGANPLQTAAETPPGPMRVPTPYGGPGFPVIPPQLLPVQHSPAP